MAWTVQKEGWAWAAVALGAALLSASPALARSGELHLTLNAGAEFGLIDMTRPGLTRESDYTAPFAPLGRFGGKLEYGLSNAWHVGVGMSFGLAENLEFDGITAEGWTGALFADYRELTWPVSVAFHLNRGHAFGGVFFVEVGPSLVRLRDLGLVDKSIIDETGGYGSFGIENKVDDRVGLHVAVGADFAWRLLDIDPLGVVVSGGPYAAAKVSANGFAVMGGVVFRPVLVLGILAGL